MEEHRFIPKAKVVDREDAVLKLANGKDVLHIGMVGCVGHSEFAARYTTTDLTQTLHGRLSRVASTLTGLDVNLETIRAMRERVSGNYFIGDIMDPELPEKVGRKFGVILFPDVIEHLDCFRPALQNIKNLLKKWLCGDYDMQCLLPGKHYQNAIRLRVGS